VDAPSQVATVEPDEATSDTWKQEGEEEVEGQEENPRRDALGNYRNPGAIPGPRGGLITPRWTSENRPRGGRPKGRISLEAELYRQLEEHPESSREIVAAWIATAKNPKSKRQVAALLPMVDRVDGPVVRETRTESVQARVVVSASGVTLPPPRDARGSSGLPASAIGPGGPEEAVQRDGVPPPGAPVLLVTSQGSAVGNEPPGGNPSSGSLEQRMGALESQMGQVVQMLQALMAKGST
jgi:hypothetical protein